MLLAAHVCICLFLAPDMTDAFQPHLDGRYVDLSDFLE